MSVAYFWFNSLLTRYAFVVKNVLFTAYFPISSAGAFDNMGFPYNISAIITPDGLFDEAKYKAYSPLYLSATLQLAYGTQFAVITAVIVHTFREYLSPQC